MNLVVLTVDQRASRTRPDLVPATVEALSTLPTLRAFERTAGDEIQGVIDDPDVVVAALALLLRGAEWNIGIGIGPVETPLPPQARAGRGAAYLQAREAVNRAKTVPAHVSVVGVDGYRAEQLETVLWLWADLLQRRSARGWEVADLIAEGISHAEAGARLGVTQSAVSQRARTAGVVEGDRAARLARQLIAEMMAEGGT
ncbi:transposase [Nocardioides sp.]|uniref:transposase n=1 Tax=Nocardioides sp. TaxID=35761 RepID=UPI003D0F1659